MNFSWLDVNFTNSRRSLWVCAALMMVCLVLSDSSRSAAPEATAPFTFENIAAAAGLNYKEINYATETKYPFETLGGAVAALDYNNDGRVDLFFLNGAPSPEHVRTDPASFNRLYRNNGNGTFTDVTEAAGLTGRGIKGYPQGVATGDYDNDGFVDIYVTNYGDNVLYRNNGDGTFSDVTARAGVAMSRYPFKASACWLDADNDGYLDLFVTHYFQWTFKDNAGDYCGQRKPGYRAYCTPDVFKPLPNVLFHNNGDGTFTDISEQAGLNKSLGKGMGVAISDYDNDGWMDIFVSNDKMPNFLYHNEGHGVFKEVALRAGVYSNESATMVSGMGCDFNDYNNDGLPRTSLAAAPAQRDQEQQRRYRRTDSTDASIRCDPVPNRQHGERHLFGRGQAGAFRTWKRIRRPVPGDPLA